MQWADLSRDQNVLLPAPWFSISTRTCHFLPRWHVCYPVWIQAKNGFAQLLFYSQKWLHQTCVRWRIITSACIKHLACVCCWVPQCIYWLWGRCCWAFDYLMSWCPRPGITNPFLHQRPSWCSTGRQKCTFSGSISELPNQSLWIAPKHSRVWEQTTISHHFAFLFTPQSLRL